MQKRVGIKFASNKVYHFDPGEKEYKLGDEVVVETASGLAVGTVAQETQNHDKKNQQEDLKPVLRLVTDKDRQKKEDMQLRSKEVLPEIEKKVKKLGLQMNIVGCEFSLDGSRVVITFTADGRVDFRELLKELAAMLKIRIELRQIGTRDEVKAIGGMGLCGMECCCKRFLDDAEHVSVKMAKTQGLSLAPTKINGLCGRLMCCLAYENDVYIEKLSRLPKIGSQVKTTDGVGTVQYNDILKERVVVKIFSADDSFQIKDFPLSEVEVRERPKNPNIKNNEDFKGKEKQTPKTNKE